MWRCIVNKEFKPKVKLHKIPFGTFYFYYVPSKLRFSSFKLGDLELKCVKVRNRWVQTNVRLQSEETIGVMNNTVTENCNGIQAQCPRCQSWCSKGSGSMRTLCQPCSKQLRRVYQFCWACRREWPKEVAFERCCSLPKCGLRAALLSPETITIPGASVVGCPFFRVCPGCKALVSHMGTGCRNLKCPDCRIWFCFRCLKKGICMENCRIVDNSSSIRDLKL